MQPTIPVVTPEQQKANYAAQNDTTTSPVKVGGSVADTTITSSSMAPTTPVPLATPTNKAADYSSSIAQVATDLASQSAIAQKQADSLLQQGKSTSNEVAAMQALLGGKASDTATTYEVQGVNKLYNQLADLNAQATGLANEAKAIPIQVEQQAMGIGATDAGIAPIQAARLRENALKALSLGQQAAIANAQYDKAKNYADQIVNAKYDQLQANINAKLTNLTALKDFELTPAQTKARDLQERRLKAEEAQLAAKKANEKEQNDLLINAAQYAPKNVISQAQAVVNRGGSTVEVANALGQYGGDYLGNLVKKSTIARNQADIAKTYADIRKVNAEIKASQTPLPNTSLPGTTTSFVTTLANSAVNKESLSQTERTAVTKNLTVLDQLDSLQKNISAQNKTGFFKGNVNNLVAAIGQNADVGTINAQLQAIVPNLARGVYGEVGVLTDNDIANYRKTLPNLTSPNDQNDAVLALTLKTVQNNLKNTLLTAANSKIDVSRFTPQYLEVTKKINEINDRIGVNDTRVSEILKGNPQAKPLVEAMIKQGASGSQILQALGAE